MDENSALGDDVICNNEALVHLMSDATVSQWSALNASLNIGAGEITICRHAWVMAKAVLEPGSVIEDGAVVAAGARVNGRVEGWTIVGGDPPRLIGKRNRHRFMDHESALNQPDRDAATSLPASQSSLSFSSIGFYNRARRAIWATAWTLIGKPRPGAGFWRRVYLLNLFGSSVARTAKIDGRAKIWAPWNLTVDANATIARDAVLYSVGKIEIGEGAAIGVRAILCTGSHDYNDRTLPLLTGNIKVDRQASIESNVFVAPGITIGAGAVVAQDSVIVRSVAAGAVVSGNPATGCK